MGVRVGGHPRSKFLLDFSKYLLKSTSFFHNIEIHRVKTPENGHLRGLILCWLTSNQIGILNYLNMPRIKSFKWYEFESVSSKRSKVFIAQISIAPVRIFLHWSSENISEYFKTSEPFTLFSVTNA